MKMKQNAAMAAAGCAVGAVNGIFGGGGGMIVVPLLTSVGKRLRWRHTRRRSLSFAGESGEFDRILMCGAV